jgi:hypothetical protein
MKRLVQLVCFGLLTGIAQAGPISYTATLSGANEAPPNASPGTGTAFVTIDAVAHILEVSVIFSGLTSGNTAAHVHCCTAVPLTGTVGVATTTPTFTGFPTGATSGTYHHLFDLTQSSSFNGSFVNANGGTPAGAEAALAAGLAAGRAYLNIHTSPFPGGEIRGFLTQTPEPGTLLLVGLPLLGLAAAARRKRS